MIVVLIIGVVMILAAAAIRYMNDPAPSPLAYKPLGVLGVLILIVGIVLTGYVSVPAGYRGVLLKFGAVEGVLGEGAHFIMPGVEDVQLMEVRTQRFDTQGTSASSHDLQIATTDVVVNYHLNPSDVATLYNTVGMDYQERVIAPKVQETLKAIVAQYTAEQLITQREIVKNQIDDGLTSTLAQYHIIIDPSGVSLTNFDFSQQFDQAIESKQVAEQQVEQQKYTLAQATLIAQTAITQAKGEAEANRIKAAALEAPGGRWVLSQAWIAKWNGDPPQVLSGSSSGLMLNLGDLQNAKG